MVPKFALSPVLRRPTSEDALHRGHHQDGMQPSQHGQHQEDDLLNLMEYSSSSLATPQSSPAAPPAALSPLSPQWSRTHTAALAATPPVPATTPQSTPLCFAARTQPQTVIDALAEASDTRLATTRTATTRPPPESPSKRHSIASTASLASLSSSSSSSFSSSTTSTLGRFWSPSASPGPVSPLSSAAPGHHPPSTTASLLPSSTTRDTSHVVVTYIPPLVDGACGTMSRLQRAQQKTDATSVDRRRGRSSSSRRNREHENSLPSARELVRADVQWLRRSAPVLLRLLWATATAPLLSLVLPPLGSQHADMRDLSAQPLSVVIAAIRADAVDAAEAVLQIGLAALEMGVLAAAPPLFLCLPGSMFVVWLASCMACTRLACAPLNRALPGPGPTARPRWLPAGVDVLDGDDDDDEDDDDDDDTCESWGQDQWFFVSGLGATSRSLAQTAARLSAVFGRPVTVVRPGRTYGAAADLASALLQRLLLPYWMLAALQTNTLYHALRKALLHDDNRTGCSPSSPPRVVVLAHNTGAIAVAHALGKLLADLPAARLARLEIYTFGSLAPDFVLPGGVGARTESSPAPSRVDTRLRPLLLSSSSSSPPAPTPHVEHFAHVRDPCARFGVLRSVRDDLAGRYGGGVFVLGEQRQARAGAGALPPMPPPISPLTPLTPVTPGTPGPSGPSGPRTPPYGSQRCQHCQHRRYQSSALCHYPQARTQTQTHQPRYPHGRSVSVSSTMTSDSDQSAMDSHGARQPLLPLSSPPRRMRTAAAAATAAATTTSHHRHRSTARRQAVLSMEDYLEALFGPEPWRGGDAGDDDDAGGDLLHAANNMARTAYFADATLAVDRDLAERREMTAMSLSRRRDDHASSGYTDNSNSSSSSGGRAPAKPATWVSWTGLGAVAADMPRRSRGSSRERRSRSTARRAVDMDGLLGLEAARRACRASDGRRGRDVSRLAGHYLERRGGRFRAAPGCN